MRSIVPPPASPNRFVSARLTGSDIDDAEFNELQNLTDKSGLPWTMRFKLWMQRVVDKAGFFGILLCASVGEETNVIFPFHPPNIYPSQIPNPLFDLAGITCGYLLIPFTTFFAAVLIGKAIFKVQLQVRHQF